MYQRGIIHIIMIIVGLAIVAVLIGMFSIPSRPTPTYIQTTTTQSY